ncbi:putative oxidoreductase [Sphingomonas changbaiensis NBRC 104936]|uniref:Putative oxidoreductase n=1 Tax=Sphingomonas changbaiensis NBRC 104936 TaxID=1219043 RepID=A0A0E9MKJ2_9SPHN|nr:putative oxidoreductase [Sphingomonas changbaiensis NBRC 104936]
MTQVNLAQAFELAAAGRPAEALAIVDRGVSAGDPQACYALGLWRLEGAHVPRDLGAARRLVEQAEQGGLMLAARALSAFVAVGTGGEADWPGALGLLHRWVDRDPLAARQLQLIEAMDLDGSGNPRGAFACEPLSDAPCVRRFPGFFSADEAAFLRDVAEARFRPALALDEQAGRFVRHPFRDATAAAFPAVFEWPAIHALNRRIAAASGTEAGQGEPLQVLRYQPGQQYRPHLDAVPGVANQRIWTMLVALNDDYQGGATVFPEASLAFRGRTGDGLLFRNVDEGGRADRTSLHAGTPVEAGVKLIASRWIREHCPPPGEAFGQHEVLSQADEVGQ